MKLNYTQINHIIEIYNSKIQSLDATIISIPTSIKFGKLLREFEIYHRTYETRLQNIISKYGEKDDNGNFVYLNDEKTIIKWMDGMQIQANQELQNLYNFELEVDIEPFTAEEMKDLQPHLTIQEMINLSYIVS